MSSKSRKSVGQSEKKQADTIIVNTTDYNDVYMEIWKIEQEQRHTKWTITTFFMSVSFAILAFSFQTTSGVAESFAARIVGLVIYWFAYILYQDHNKLNIVLRNYLINMEKMNQVTLNLQSSLIALSYKRGQILASSLRALFIFGVIYTFGVILLWFLKV